MIKLTATLSNIPSDVIFACIADIDIRRKWDEIMQNLTIVKEDLDEGSCIFHYNIPTPAFIKNRDALIKRLSLRDFP